MWMRALCTPTQTKQRASRCVGNTRGNGGQRGATAKRATGHCGEGDWAGRATAKGGPPQHQSAHVPAHEAVAAGRRWRRARDPQRSGHAVAAGVGLPVAEQSAELAGRVGVPRHARRVRLARGAARRGINHPPHLLHHIGPLLAQPRVEARHGAVAGVVAGTARGRPRCLHPRLVLRRRSPPGERLPGEPEARDHPLVPGVRLGADRALARKMAVCGAGVGGGDVLLAEARVAAVHVLRAVCVEPVAPVGRRDELVDGPVGRAPQDRRRGRRHVRPRHRHGAGTHDGWPLVDPVDVVQLAVRPVVQIGGVDARP